MPTLNAPPIRKPIPPAARVTIADVAHAAGVSKATVSRFLNRRDELLTPDIAARVQTAIATLRYTPSPMAQALKRGRSRLIGLVVADITNPYSVAVLRGAERACQDAGYLVMLFNLGNDKGREREAIEALLSYHVEGFILNRVGDDSGAVAEAVRCGKPVVMVDRRHDDLRCDFVSLDNAAAIQLGAQHLVESGYGELLFVSEPVHGVSSRLERQQAFCAFMREQRPGIVCDTCESTEADPQALELALRALRRRAAGRPFAVLSGNAVITLRLVAAAARLGWRLGAEIGLVGFDDTDWAPFVGPGLTTIAQPTDDLGRLAAECVLGRLQGADHAPHDILLPGRLVARGSSQPGGLNADHITPRQG